MGSSNAVLLRVMRGGLLDGGGVVVGRSGVVAIGRGVGAFSGWVGYAAAS